MCVCNSLCPQSGNNVCVQIIYTPVGGELRWSWAPTAVAPARMHIYPTAQQQYTLHYLRSDDNREQDGLQTTRTTGGMIVKIIPTSAHCVHVYTIIIFMEGPCCEPEGPVKRGEV